MRTLITFNFWQSFGLNYIRNKNNLPSVKLTAPEGSKPCRGRRARVPRKPLELCPQELRLLVGPPKLDRSKGRGPTKRDPLVLQVRGLSIELTTLSVKHPCYGNSKKPPYVPHGIMGISEGVCKTHEIIKKSLNVTSLLKER